MAIKPDVTPPCVGGGAGAAGGGVSASRCGHYPLFPYKGGGSEGLLVLTWLPELHTQQGHRQVCVAAEVSGHSTDLEEYPCFSDGNIWSTPADKKS